MNITNAPGLAAFLTLADIIYGVRHYAKRMTCCICLHQWIAGIPEGCNEVECPKCGQMTPSAWGSDDIFEEGL